jgi:hypothetical protein
VKHLKDERTASTHLDLTNIETEAEERFKEGTLSIRLTSNGNNFRNGESLAECNRGGLESVVGFKARFGIGMFS